MTSRQPGAEFPAASERNEFAVTANPIQMYGDGSPMERPRDSVRNEGSRPTFVGGHQRSGTTLLASLIGLHPDVATLQATGVPHDEGQFLQDVYRSEVDMTRRYTVQWGYSLGAHLTEADAEEPEALRYRLLRSWGPYWNREADHIVEKSPSNCLKTRYLQALFPEANFVVITRHPLVQALATRKWWDTRARAGLRMDAAIAHWLFVMDRYERDRRELNSSLMCSYEELVAAPTATLERIFEFMGLSQVSIPVDSVAAEDRYVKYWESFRRGIAASGFTPLCERTTLRSTVPLTVESISRLIGPYMNRRLTLKYEDKLNHFGYSMRSLDTCSRKD